MLAVKQAVTIKYAIDIFENCVCDEKITQEPPQRHGWLSVPLFSFKEYLDKKSKFFHKLSKISQPIVPKYY